MTTDASMEDLWTRAGRGLAKANVRELATCGGVTNQLPTAEWYTALVEPTVADAICDRVVHNAHLVHLKGASGRKRKGLNTNS